MLAGVLASKRLAVLFAVCALVMAAIVVQLTPPFMGPDEPNHLRRVNMTLLGEFVGFKVQTPKGLFAGGYCEPSVDDAFRPLSHIPGNLAAKADAATMVQATAVHWAGPAVPTTFPNTAVYSPLLYLHQSAALYFGKLQGLPVVQTLTLVRATNAAVCIVVAALAVSFAGRAAPYLATVLLWPKVIFLMSTCTQDGLVIALTGLAFSLLWRAHELRRGLKNGELVAAVVALALVAMAKPPYVFFPLLALLAPAASKRVRAWAVAVGMAVGVAWHMAIVALVQTPLSRADAVLDPSAQLTQVLHHPAAFLVTLGHTIVATYKSLVVELVGSLGVMDTPMPSWYFALAFVILGLAAAVVLSAAKPAATRFFGVAALQVVTTLLLFLGLYMAWTPVGAPIIEGMQGRYFLPLVVLLPVAFVGAPKGELNKKVAPFIGTVVLLMPVVSTCVLWQTLTTRYY